MENSLSKILDDLEAHLKVLYPFLDEGDLDRMTRLSFGVSFFCDSEEEFKKWVTRILQDLDAPWAKKITENLGKEITRSVTKARAAGTDPVEFVRVTYGLSREDAAKAVEATP